MLKNKKARKSIIYELFESLCYDISRVDWIRTSDPLHPMQVRYRAAPPPETGFAASRYFMQALLFSGLQM